MANAEINKEDLAAPSISQSSLDYELNQTTPRSDGSLKTGKSTNSPNASKVLHFIIHPCDPTVVICYLIWLCDIAVRITYLISHSSSFSYNTVIKGYF